MLSYCRSAALFGIDAHDVEIEFDVGNGLPAVIIVGLPDAAVKESRDRVRSAVNNSGFKFPEKRITINLAPADIKKEGPVYDLPIALGILAAADHIPPEILAQYCILGELALDGTVRPVKGILPIAVNLRQRGHTRMVVAPGNAAEAAVVQGMEVYPVHSLAECVSFLRREKRIASLKVPDTLQKPQGSQEPAWDFADVKGQAQVKRAIEVAAAGGHNLLLMGPPGSGKSMLARRIPSIMPPLSIEESLATTKIHSVARGPVRSGHGLVVQRPFRSPHHTISQAGLIGGGTDLKPGEVSLAHNGILFLDEFPEFRRDALEVLREPLEEKWVTITRASGTVRYPAHFMLVAAMNPCPCGYLTDPRKDCCCSPYQVQKYLRKISGPLLDRIDIHVEVPPVHYQELVGSTQSESSAVIRGRVKKTRVRQRERLKPEGIYVNAGMHRRLIQKHCVLENDSQKILKAAFNRLNLSVRAHDRILKVARTIADMEGSESPRAAHIAEAISFRTLDRNLPR